MSTDMRASIVLSFFIVFAGAGCTSTRLPPETPVGLADRTGVPARPGDITGTAIPPGVQLDDGLTQDEAVAVALWNNPDFQVQLADLGFARADLLEAGLLRNPVLSLLFPVGPKQLEATLKWPIEVLWERPRRIAAARVAADRAAASLEQHGLVLVSDVKIAYIDLALAQDRARLAEQAAAELDQINQLTQSRLKAGDISELEARTAAIDAARARHEARRAGLDIALRANDLRARLGLALDPTAISIVPAVTGTIEACGPATTLLTEALASRPDVRAAELAVEAAGHQLGWENSRILALSAILDVNGSGAEGVELGPGVEIGAPIFDRNQGGRARAGVELQRASRAYVAARQRVASELRDASTLVEQANASLTGWRDTVLAPLEEQVRAAERTFADGETSYLFVLEMNRRLTEARLRAREAEADLARALTRTERAIGRRCGTAGKVIARGF